MKRGDRCRLRADKFHPWVGVRTYTVRRTEWQGHQLMVLLAWGAERWYTLAGLIKA